MKNNNKIKVAWFTDDIDRKTKGQATYSQKLIEQLVNNYADQIDLTLVHREGKCHHPVCKLAKNITIKTFKLPMLSGTFSWLWFFITTKEKFDIFMVPRHNLYPGFLIAKWRGKIKKFVVTLHGAPDKFTPKHFRKAGSWWNFHIKYLAKPFVDIFLAVSETGKKQIAKYYNIKSDKINYFYNSCKDNFRPIEDAGMPGCRDVLKKKYNIKQPYIVQVGRFDPHKNVHRLVKAYAKLKREYKINQYLILVGGRHLKDYSEKVDNIIKENNLENDVIITKDIEAEDMPAIYGAADLAVNLSLNEGFGLPLVEAMKVGVAQVVSDIPVYKEVAGDAVKYVDPLDLSDIAAGIDQVLQNQELKEQLTSKGLARGQVFSWEKSASKLVDIYKSIL